MSEPQWPQEIVDRVNRIGVDYPDRCGQNSAGYAADSIGCGKQLTNDLDRYKCIDCDVTFHRGCARKHFGESRDDLHAKLGVYERQHEIITAQLQAMRDRVKRLQALDPSMPLGAAFDMVDFGGKP